MKSFMLPAFFALTTLLFNSCKSTETIIVPLDKTHAIHDTYTLLWYGKSEAYRYQDNKYIRAEEFDYIFEVVQKRYHDTWKSVKTLHRDHPGYNGKAGARTQHMYFEVKYTISQNGLTSLLATSLGNGQGTSDHEFREQSFVLELKNISKMAPYNKMKITQHYHYESGELKETVELYKEKGGKIIPFMKNEETAKFYLNGKLDQAPTSLK